jgi:hypothetical protein
MSEIIIKGMHCDACIALVTMELEEGGFEGEIKSVELIPDNFGKVILVTDEADRISEVKNIINNMENYNVYE